MQLLETFNIKWAQEIDNKVDANRVKVADGLQGAALW